MKISPGIPQVFKVSATIVVLLGLVLLGAGVSAGEKLNQNRESLEKIQQRIRKIARSLKSKRVEEEGLRKDMATLDSEIERLKGREKDGIKSLATLQEKTNRQEDLIAAIREKSRNRRKMVKKRLSAMYRDGQTPLLRLLFSGNPPGFIAEEYHLLKRVVRHDRELLDQYRRDQEELNENLTELKTLRDKTRVELDNLERGRKALAEGKGVKRKLLARLKNQQARMAGELAQLKEKAARLQSLVKRLEREKSREYTEKAGVFAAQKGRLPWPVKGRVKVGFGTCRLPSSGTLYDCQGVEIETQKDRPIKACWGGTVIFAKPFKGYGNLIIIDHGNNYYTLYAQASRLRKTVGDQVKTGEVVGYSGFENADSVYFEIRHRGTPQDPLTWLKTPS